MSDHGTGGIALVVDGVPTLGFHQVEGRAGDPYASSGGLAGATLVGLRTGMTVEEAVATALLLRDLERSMAPTAVQACPVDRRAWRVLELMASQASEVGSGTVRTAVAVLIVRHGKLLLGTKPKTKAFVADRLYLPGGKLKQGESPTEAARRELQEETGLEAQRLEVCGFSCHDHRGMFYRFTQFLGVANGDVLAADDMDSLSWRDPRDLRREELFDLTWAQLFLLQEYGQSIAS